MMSYRVEQLGGSKIWPVIKVIQLFNEFIPISGLDHTDISVSPFWITSVAELRNLGNGDLLGIVGSMRFLPRYFCNYWDANFSLRLALMR